MYCKGGFWFLSPKDEWIKAQIAQYNEFVESGLKLKLDFDGSNNAQSESKIVRK